MVRIDAITKEWREAGSFPAQINLFGFWDELAFLTKSGDLGTVLKIGGIDYESLDHAGRDYAVKRLEAALRSLDDRCRLYQILFKHNRPAIPHAQYDNPLVRAAVEQRAAFLQSKADRLYSIEIFWVVMVDGSYQKTGLLHALAGHPLFYDQIVSYLLTLSFNPRRFLEADTITQALDFTAHRSGVALVPQSASRFQRPGGLFKPLTDDLIRIETALFVRKDQVHSSVQDFMTVARSAIAAQKLNVAGR